MCGGRFFRHANQSVVLHAVFEDGTVVSGESKIPNCRQENQAGFLTPDEDNAAS